MKVGLAQWTGFDAAPDTLDVAKLGDDAKKLGARYPWVLKEHKRLEAAAREAAEKKRKRLEAAAMEADAMEAAAMEAAPWEADAVTDAAVLSTMADATLMVMRAHVTRKDVARHALTALRKVGTPVTGCIINAVDFARHEYRGSYYYYHRDYYGNDDASA